MTITAYIEHEGVTFIPCHYCGQFIEQEQLGKHLRSHREPLNVPAVVVSTPPSLHKVRHSPELRRKLIKQICAERNIQKLVHFTRIESLSRILQEGLLPRSKLERQGRKGRSFIAVDPDRFDGHRHAISISITFPNNLMFFKLQNQTGPDPWVVLSLDPSILWELDCAFCTENAAAVSMRQRRLADLKKVYALEEMFAETVSLHGVQINRADLAISPAYPTNPQAEILVCEPIKPRYIRDVAFYNHRIRSRWTDENGVDWPTLTLSINHGFYRSRPGNWDILVRDLEITGS